MIIAGEIKILPPIQTTLSGDGMRSFQVYKIFFTIRGNGSYSVEVPVEGFTPQIAQAAIEAKANEIIDTLDLFK